MDGVLLWNGLYRAVRKIDAIWTPGSPGRGHPDDYSLGEIVGCWLWAAFQHKPLSVMTRALGDERYLRAQRFMGFRLPPRCPHATTLRRRSLRQDFLLFLLVLSRWLTHLLAPRTGTMLIDSTPQPVPFTSRDTDATWGHHALRGYRLHTLASADRVILEWSVHGAHEHELAVAPLRLRLAGAWGWRADHLSGDVGYDSETMHLDAHRHLGATMVAPFNDRGGRRTMTNTPRRRALRRRWTTHAVRCVRRRRSEIERLYSVLKSSLFGLSALPPWVRGLASVERWLHLKILLYHAHLLIERRKPLFQ